MAEKLIIVGDNLMLLRVEEPKRDRRRGECCFCGVPFKRHLDLKGTCEQLRLAIDTLRDIAATPRGGGARRNAMETVAIIAAAVKKAAKRHERDH